MTQQDGEQRRSLGLSEAVTFAQAFLGVLALLFYPVGLLTLWLQVMLSYRLDGLTAWYATSLLPTPVVAGKILDILLPWASFAFLLTLATSWIIVSRLRRGLLALSILLFLSVLWPPLISFVLPGGVLFLEVWLYLSFIVLCFVGGVQLARSSTTEGGQQGRSLSFRVSLPSAVFAVLGAVFLTGLQSLYLPSVEFETDKRENQRVGTLLSHSNGYWYVIECENVQTTLPYSPDLAEIHIPGKSKVQSSEDEQLIIPESSDDLIGLTNKHTKEVAAQRRLPFSLGVAVSAIPDDKAGVVRFLEPPPVTATFAQFATTQDVTLCLY